MKPSNLSLECPREVANVSSPYVDFLLSPTVSTVWSQRTNLHWHVRRQLTFKKNSVLGQKRKASPVLFVYEMRVAGLKNKEMIFWVQIHFIQHSSDYWDNIRTSFFIFKVKNGKFGNSNDPKCLLTCHKCQYWTSVLCPCITFHYCILLLLNHVVFWIGILILACYEKGGIPFCDLSNGEIYLKDVFFLC